MNLGAVRAKEREVGTEFLVFIIRADLGVLVWNMFWLVEYGYTCVL